MDSRHMEEKMPARKSWWSSFGIVDIFTAGISIAAVLPSAQYALGFPDTDASEVNYDWLTSQSDGRIFGSLICGACTLVVSSFWTYRYLRMGGSKMKDETLEYIRTRRNKKRFLTSAGMALLAAITGGSVSGGPYQGVIRWLAQALGFVVGGALSFIGMTDLILHLSDKDADFQKILLEVFKNIDPIYQGQMDCLLRGKTLNAESVPLLVRGMLDLSLELNLQNNVAHLSLVDDSGLMKAAQISDYVSALTFSGLISLIYIENGFDGTNLIVADNMSDLSLWQKILIGFLPGLPSTLFNFFAIKEFRDTMLRSYPEMMNSSASMVKAFVLFMFAMANSTWIYSLGRSIPYNQNNIYGMTLDSRFGRFYPVACYVTSYIVGLNGVVPVLFSENVNVVEPKIKDVVRWLERNKLSSEVLGGLMEHSFFNKSDVGVELSVNVVNWYEEGGVVASLEL